MMISVMWYTLSPDEGMQPLSHNVTCNPENILGCKLRVQLLERNGWTQTTLCFIMVCCMSLSSEQKLLSKCREFIFTFGTLKVLCVKVGGLSQGFLLTPNTRWQHVSIRVSIPSWVYTIQTINSTFTVKLTEGGQDQGISATFWSSSEVWAWSLRYNSICAGP